ncbi:MAG: hypothetical protein WDN46_22805 [Methylocella sp.]
MISNLKKGAIATVAAASLGLASAATATPAAAAAFHGGFHGGGWHGGGWRGAGWHGGYWRGGRWYGGGWGVPLAAGLAVGALAGAAAYPYYGYGAYGGCYVQNQPTYDGWGRFVGYQPARVCY